MSSTFSHPTQFPTVGILGGGQLGRMLALAGIRMGLRIRFLSPKPAGPMLSFADATVGDWKDPDVLRRFAEPCTAVTVESEWAPGDHMAEVLPDGVSLWPAPETVHLIRHKGRQKDALAQAGLPVPSFRRCTTLEGALEAAEALGYPVVLKQYRGSYDGYGNATATKPDDVRAAWQELGSDDGLLVESFVDFERELSVLIARRADGEHVTYPVAYTEQRDHRCHAVVVPADLSEATLQRAREVALGAVEAVKGVGITAVELFETGPGEVLINELAPRPHNTGHYTIEGCHTSQYENHLRAILGWPLGDPSLRAPATVMVNLLGERQGSPPRPKGLEEALAVPGAAVHIYDKPEVRPNRKMGHVTVTGKDAEDVRVRAEKAAEHIHL